jgi:Carboxypeptidase regulatory-like domain
VISTAASGIAGIFLRKPAIQDLTIAPRLKVRAALLASNRHTASQHSKCRDVVDCLFYVGRRSKPFLATGSVLLIFALTRSLLLAQESFSLTAHDPTLPDAPQPAQARTQSGSFESQQVGGGSLSGTVLDRNRNVLQGARVTVAGPSGSAVRTVESGNNGQFAFTGLPPDVYKLTVTSAGMSTFISPQIPLHTGEFRILPPVILAVSAVATSVTVSENKEQLAEEQVQIAIQQRIGGIIPNFYSSYDWNAPPMLAKQKFQLSIRAIFDPVSFLGVAGVAGVQQYKNAFPAYGGGIEGYGKRYGAAFANDVSGTLLGRAVYPSMFHQDPRYFYKGKGSIRSRMLYAISAAVIARNDDGQWKPNYSLVLGSFSAAAISNLYYPASDRGASLVVFNGLASTGAHAASNLIREFVLKRITTHVPKGANGQP